MIKEMKNPFYLELKCVFRKDDEKIVSYREQQLDSGADQSTTSASFATSEGEVMQVGGLWATCTCVTCACAYNLPQNDISPPNTIQSASRLSWQQRDRTGLSRLFFAHGRSNVSEDKSSISVSHLLSACLHLSVGFTCSESRSTSIQDVASLLYLFLISFLLSLSPGLHTSSSLSSVLR